MRTCLLLLTVNVSGPEDRRRKLLADAKDRRRDFLAHARQLAQAVTEDAAMDLDGDAPISASTTDAPHLTSPMYNLPTATGARPSLSFVAPLSFAQSKRVRQERAHVVRAALVCRAV